MFDRFPHHTLLCKIKQQVLKVKYTNGSQIYWTTDTKEWWSTDVNQSGRLTLLGSVLGPVLFIFYINDVDVGLNILISKFADDTRLVIRSSLTETDNAPKRICKIYQLCLIDGRCSLPLNKSVPDSSNWLKNKSLDSEMCGVKLKSVQCVKDLGVKIPTNIKFSQQCIDAANKMNRMLGYIKRNFSFKNEDVIFLMCNS